MLENALVSSVKKLQEAKKKALLLDFAIIGGFAVSTWGYPRATEDIDFAISAERNKLKELAEFLKGELRQGDSSDPLIATINFEMKECLIQLILFPRNWETLAFKDIKLVSLKGKDVPVVGWKEIVLLKLYAGSAADLLDAKRVIDAQEPGQRALDSLREISKQFRVSKKLDRAMTLKR
jgi:hypothetical protein